MKKIIKALLALMLLLATSPAQAFTPGAFYAGIGYFSQNFLNETSNSADGSTGFLGEASYPLLLKYDYNYSGDWYFAPQLGYTLLPRKAEGDTAEITTLHLIFQWGSLFAVQADSRFDWWVGPGYLKYDIKGKGGTTVLSNGTSTSVFPIPGGSSSIQKVTLNFGTSYTMGSSRFGLEITVESPFSSTKRTQDLMFSYMYHFGGGLF